MHYVYTLKSLRANQTYTGFTKDLISRIKDHNSGKSIHTNKFKPWKLVSYVAFNSEESARKFEKYLKTGSGIAFSRKHLID